MGQVTWEAVRRIAREAVYSTTISRSAVEFEWPECHKAKCQGQHGSADDAFHIMASQIAENVETAFLMEEHK